MLWGTRIACVCFPYSRGKKQIGKLTKPQHMLQYGSWWNYTSRAACRMRSPHTIYTRVLFTNERSNILNYFIIIFFYLSLPLNNINAILYGKFIDEFKLVESCMESRWINRVNPCVLYTSPCMNMKCIVIGRMAHCFSVCCFWGRRIVDCTSENCHLSGECEPQGTMHNAHGL